MAMRRIIYWFHPKYLMPQAKISDGKQRDFRVSPHSPSRIGSGSSPYAVHGSEIRVITFLLNCNDSMLDNFFELNIPPYIR